MFLNPNITPKSSWLNIGVLSAGHFVGDFYSNILPVMLPILALQFGLSFSECGLLFMIFQVSASLLQAPIGIAADNKNLGLIFPLSILFGGVLCSLVGLSSSVLMLVCIVGLSGICQSGFHPIAGGMVPSLAPKGKTVLATSIFIVCGNIGFAISPFLTAIYLKHFEQQELWYLAIFPILITLLIFKQKLYTRPVAKTNGKNVSLKIILANKPFLYLVASIGCRSICYCALVLYIPLLFTSKGISSVSSSAILMTMLIGTAIGGLAVGGLASKFRLKTMIICSYILTTVMMIVFLIKADDSLISYISIFFAGVGLYGSTPPAIVWAQRLLPKADSFATSMMLGFTFGIGYSSCVFVGLLGDLIGLHQALWYSIIASLLGAIAIIIKVKEKN